MLKSTLLAGAAALALVADARAQVYHDNGGSAAISTVPLIGCTSSGNCAGPVSPSNPLPVAGTFSASLGGYQPSGSYATPLTVSTTSSRVALPAGTTIVVYNVGSSAAFVTLGGASVTATTAGDVIQPNSWVSYAVGGNTYLAAITANGASSLNISGGSGLPTGAGGGSSSGGGGSVPTGSAGSPSASVVSVQGVPGGSPLSAALAAGSSTIGAISNSAFGISGALPGFASTPTVNLGSIGTAATAANQPTLNGDGGALAHVTNFPATQPISASSLPLPAGAATVAAQSSVQSAPGSSATTAVTIQGSASGVAVPVTGTLSASVGGFAPAGAYATPLSVSTSSANVALPTGTTVAVYNTGANSAFVKLGAGNVTATTGNDMIPAGGWLALTVGSNAYLAAITASGATTLNLSGGAGLLTGSGGGGGGSGGGSVSISGSLPAGSNALGSVSVSNLPATQAVSASSLPLPSGAATAANQTSVQSSPGAAASNAVTVQGSPSGVALPVSVSSIALPSGASTAANQTSVQSSPGTTASTAVTIQGSTSGVPVPVSGSIAVTTFDSGAIRVSATPSSSAHGAGTSVGGLLSIPVARVNGGSGIITSAMLWTSWGSTQTYVMRVWQKQPSNTTCADGAAFVSSAADDSSLVGPGPISVLLAAPANTTGDAKTYAYLAPLSWDYKNSDTTTSQNVYACLVTNGADTPGASAVLSLTMSGPQN